MAAAATDTALKVRPSRIYEPYAHIQYMGMANEMEYNAAYAGCRT